MTQKCKRRPARGGAAEVCRAGERPQHTAIVLLLAIEPDRDRLVAALEAFLAARERQQ
jgi:hypothetical protein